MDVKGVIQAWYRELAEDALAFEQQAQRVGVWDQQLRENQKVGRDYCLTGLTLLPLWDFL